MNGIIRFDTVRRTMLKILVAAAMNGDLNAVRAVLAHGGVRINVNGAAPRSGWTALTAAARGGHRGTLLHLVDVAHASIDHPNQDSGASALACAAFWGHLAIVEDLLVRGANVQGGGFPRPWTPLWCAAVNGHLDVAVILVKHGATAYGGDQWTLLHGGVEGGHVHVVAYALDCALAAARGQRGEKGDAAVKSATARYMAYHGHDEVFFFLDNHAATSPDAANVDAAISTPGSHGTVSLLHSAIQHGHVDIVRFLLKHAVGGHFSYTALNLAARHDHVDVVRELCATLSRLTCPYDTWQDAGPRVTAWLARTSGYSPFDLACDRGDVDAVRSLLRADGAYSGAMAVAAACSRTETYRNGPNMATLLRGARAPWCPRVHAVRPASFRAMVVPVLLALRRRGIPQGVAMFHVIAFCGRDWWRQPADGNSGLVDGNDVGDGSVGNDIAGETGVGGSPTRVVLKLAERASAGAHRWIFRRRARVCVCVSAFLWFIWWGILSVQHAAVFWQSLSYGYPYGSLEPWCQGKSDYA